MSQVSAFRLILVLLMIVGGALGPARAQSAQESRFALVIGQDGYTQGSLPTAANDAGLVADVLRDAGFDVTGVRNVDYPTLMQQAGEFIDRVSAAGPNTVAFVYYSGYGLQYSGENYLVPPGAGLATDTAIPEETLRLGELLQGLAEHPMKARIVVADVAYRHPFAPTGRPLVGGMALVDPPSGVLVAFNTAPGSIVAPPTSGEYGMFASALAEMMREGGLSIDDVLARVRLRVNQSSNGAEIPWFASRLTDRVVLFDAAPQPTATGTTPAPDPVAEMAALKQLGNKPMNQLSDEEAYTAAVADDTVASYQKYLDTHAEAKNAARVRAILAARREARWWSRAVEADTSRAYWTYLKRYPNGPHADEARARLEAISAEVTPPPVFDEVVYDDLPPPPIEEVTFVTRRPVFEFGLFGFDPPPPPPLFILPPPVFILPPPPPPVFGFLPIPMLPPPPFAMVPMHVRPPRPPIGMLPTRFDKNKGFQQAGFPQTKDKSAGIIRNPVLTRNNQPPNGLQPGKTPQNRFGPVGPADIGKNGLIGRTPNSTPGPVSKSLTGRQPNGRFGTPGPVGPQPIGQHSLTGRQGPIGQQPFAGKPGPIGQQPFTGKPGPIGQQPFTGKPGPIGQQPFTGKPGPIGQQPFTGKPGPIGQQPFTGKPGPIGQQPFTGKPGPVGQLPLTGKQRPIGQQPVTGKQPFAATGPTGGPALGQPTTVNPAKLKQMHDRSLTIRQNKQQPANQINANNPQQIRQPVTHQAKPPVVRQQTPRPPVVRQQTPRPPVVRQQAPRPPVVRQAPRPPVVRQQAPRPPVVRQAPRPPVVRQAPPRPQVQQPRRVCPRGKPTC